LTFSYRTRSHAIFAFCYTDHGSSGAHWGCKGSPSTPQRWYFVLVVNQTFPASLRGQAARRHLDTYAFQGTASHASCLGRKFWTATAIGYLPWKKQRHSYLGPTNAVQYCSCNRMSVPVGSEGVCMFEIAQGMVG
jgi:hypothetical protein